LAYMSRSVLCQFLLCQRGCPWRHDVGYVQKTERRCQESIHWMAGRFRWRGRFIVHKIQGDDTIQPEQSGSRISEMGQRREALRYRLRHTKRHDVESAERRYSL